MISIPIWLFALLIIACVPFAFFLLMFVGALITLAIDGIYALTHKKEGKGGNA